MQLKGMEVLRKGQRILESHNIPASRLEAELLMAHMLKCQRHDLYLMRDWDLDDAQAQRFFDLIYRRCEGCPIQYITNRQEFMGLEFYVDHRVLIPRADTEILVEHVIKRLSQREEPVHILDVGTGSGAIAVSLAIFLPGVRITAIDISAGALDVAKLNACRHGVQDRIAFLEGDLFSPLYGHYDVRSFDAVVSNPPYIPTQEIEGLDRHIRDYEPRIALDGGHDGLKFYSRLAGEGLDWLKAGGLLAVEVGYGQAQKVKSMLESTGCYGDIAIEKDLAGIERVVLAIRR